MKNLFLSLIIVSLASSAAQAADYKPLLEEGKSWIIARAFSGCGWVNPHLRMDDYVQRLECTVGETVEIGGEQCKRLIVKELWSGKEVKNEYGPGSEHIFLEKDQTLYVYAPYEDVPDGVNFEQVMSFACTAGDSLLVGPKSRYENSHMKYFYRYVTDELTALGPDGVERRELIIDSGLNACVEGVGAINCNGMLFTFGGFSSSDGRDINYLIECRKDGKTIFTNDNFSKPNRYGLEDVRNITPGKSWTMARGTKVFTVSVDRDSIISGITCMVLKSSEGKEYVVSEERGRVYYFPEHLGPANPFGNAVLLGGGTEKFYGNIKLTDMATGEILECPSLIMNGNAWKGHGINQLTVGDRPFNEYLFENEAGEVVASWVDGVGAPDSRSWAVVMPEDFQTLRMIDCRQDGEVIFSAEDFTYQSGIREVNADATRAAAAYDLQGRRVANPTRGLYILNGKKHLLR